MIKQVTDRQIVVIFLRLVVEEAQKGSFLFGFYCGNVRNILIRIKLGISIKMSYTFSKTNKLDSNQFSNSCVVCIDFCKFLGQRTVNRYQALQALTFQCLKYLQYIHRNRILDQSHAAAESHYSIGFWFVTEKKLLRFRSYQQVVLLKGSFSKLFLRLQAKMMITRTYWEQGHNGHVGNGNSLYPG